MLYWLIDFEGYGCGGDDFIVKEISILNSDGTQCFTYMVSSPNNYTYFPQDSTFRYQYERHHLAWENGDYSFSHAIGDIMAKVRGYCVFCKGLEKQRFLENYLPYVAQLDMVPSFKQLNSCMTEWCEYRHGKFCARRKVYELKHYIDTNGLVLN